MDLNAQAANETMMTATTTTTTSTTNTNNSSNNNNNSNITNNNNNHNPLQHRQLPQQFWSPTSNCTLKSSHDTDVVRLIGQHLVSLGLEQTVKLLLEESGLHALDHPTAAKFQQHILSGDWDIAASLVEEIANLIFSTSQQCGPGGDCYSYNQQLDGQVDHVKKKSIIKEMKLLIAEQKFLELIEDKQHMRGLKCLRLEITPLSEDMKHVQHLTTLLMCKSTEDVKLKANWLGKGTQSRQLLVERIQRFIPPLIMLPPKRLTTLLNQAGQLQRERCILHLDTPENDINSGSMETDATTTTTTTTNKSANIDTYIDLKSDHICSADKFPLSSKQELDSHKTEVWMCKFSNDGTKLATGGLGGKVKIWSVDPAERKLIEDCTYDCNSFSVTCLSWSPDDAYLLVCGSEERPNIYIWNVAKSDLQIIINPADDEHVTTCSWHLSGDRFAAASIRGNFVIYDLDGNRRGSREGVRVQCLSFLHKDPNYILAADTLNRIKSYAIKDMSVQTSEEDILTESHPIMSFVVDKDDKYVALNLMEQGVHLWDLRSRTLLRLFPGVCQRNVAIYSSFSSPNAAFLASGSEDGKVYIYHISREQPVAILHGHSRCVNCVTWNPKYPELLVSASDDRIVRLWAPIDNDDTTTKTTIINNRNC